MRRIISLFILIPFLSSCASIPKFKPNQQYESYLKTPKKIALISPDIKIFQMTAGGMTELMDEWTNEAKKNVLDYTVERINENPNISLSGIIKEEDLAEADRDFLKTQKGVLNAIARSVEAVYMPHSVFGHKRKNFDYTAGPKIAKLLEFADCDAFLFVSGSNHRWTPGRTALSVASFMMGVAVSVFTGVSVYLGPLPQHEWLTIALVEAKTGDIIWVYYKSRPGDLNADLVAKKHIGKFFYSFPKEWK